MNEPRKNCNNFKPHKSPPLLREVTNRLGGHPCCLFVLYHTSWPLSIKKALPAGSVFPLFYLVICAVARFFVFDRSFLMSSPACVCGHKKSPFSGFLKDWKSCVGLKPTGGSNPLLCAKNTGKRRKNSDLALFFRFFLFTEIFNKILLPSSLPLFISLLGIG